ncbi:tigger transposable element-derived protein 1-like [Palaemon carinicauda]|uniref:tigger transposable element-derived protein 1-like n=1 Tax=Palaemon carinicauda TaxID=392227 RepID=UPI0035B6A62E
MSEKRMNTTVLGTPVKKRRRTGPRKSIDINTKLRIIEQREAGNRVQTIANSLGLAHSTICTILKDKERVRESAKTTAGYNALITRVRRGPIHEMEKLLAIWFDDQVSKRSPINLTMIQRKALGIFNKLKAREGDACTETFTASKGWFQRFCRRFRLHNRSIYGEAASTDMEAAEKFINDLDKVIEEEGYYPEQIFNVDETGLFWKKMAERTYAHREVTNMPQFTAFQDRVTLLLGGNVAGHKLKPFFVYHSQNPPALKNVNKHTLPVFYRANTKVWMTQDLFEDWFINCFVPATREYCLEKNIPFKILLLLDNAPGHPQHIGDLYPDVKVVYLPQNTTSILQPMVQGAISAFKAYYLRTTFAKAVAATEDNEMTLRDFWKNYNILQCIKNIDTAWHEVTEKCMQGIWKKCLKRFVDNFEGFNSDANLQMINNITIDLARGLMLEVENLTNSVEGELTDEDLIELQEQRLLDEDKLKGKAYEGQKKFTTKGLAQVFSKMNEVMLDLEAMDPNVERLAKFERKMNEALSGYRKIYEEKIKERKESSILSTLGSPVHKPSGVHESDNEDPDDFANMFKSDVEEEGNTFEGFSQEEIAKNRHDKSVTKGLGNSVEKLECEEFITIKEEPVEPQEESLCGEEWENHDYFRSDCDEELKKGVTPTEEFQIKDEPVSFIQIWKENVQRESDAY